MTTIDCEEVLNSPRFETAVHEHHLWLGEIWLSTRHTLSSCLAFDDMTSLDVYTRPFWVLAGNPALCGSRPLVTPYNCRLGDLLCLFVYGVFVCYFVCACICVICVFFLFFVLFSFTAFSFSTLILLLGLLTCKNRLPCNLYCVGRDVKHCTIRSNPLHPNQKLWQLLGGHTVMYG